MRDADQILGPVWLHQLERRASRYRDPIERLRYLQRAARTLPETGPLGSSCRQRIFDGAIPPAAWKLAAGGQTRRWLQILPGVVLLGLLIGSAPGGSRSDPPDAKPAAVLSPPTAPASGPTTTARPASPVWLVETSAEFELYSNGLRVDRSQVVPGGDRRPKFLPRGAAAEGEAPPDPAGIVFHASENDPAPFLPEHNYRLKRQGENLLAWVRQRQLYHYVVDRFGQVHRILEDDRRAEHAGSSIWAEAGWVYLDLSDSFLAVCFEARTAGTEPPELSTAQLRAGRALVEMLLSRHNLPAGNCITHAQVSVNPSNHRIGYHTDWADGFPFQELGLPDNYALPPPSLTLFGFQADSVFVQRAGARLREAVQAAEQDIGARAQARGLAVEAYRRWLQEQYRQAVRRAAGA